MDIFGPNLEQPKAWKLLGKGKRYTWLNSVHFVRK